MFFSVNGQTAINNNDQITISQQLLYRKLKFETKKHFFLIISAQIQFFTLTNCGFFLRKCLRGLLL